MDEQQKTKIRYNQKKNDRYANQHHKCKQLQRKYHQYIDLLKQKLDCAEQKIEVLSKSSTAQNSNSSIQKTFRSNLFYQLEEWQKKLISTAFYAIKCESLKENPQCTKIIEIMRKNIKWTQKKHLLLRLNNSVHEKISYQMKILAFIISKFGSRRSQLKDGFKMLVKSLKRSNFKEKKDRINQLSILLNSVQRRKRTILTIAFHNLKIFNNPTTLQTCLQDSYNNLYYLKNLLSFTNKLNNRQIQNQIYTSQVSRLFVENCKLKSIISSLKDQIQILKDQLVLTKEQREKEIIKKSEGLQQIADEMREKDELIRQYQNELTVYKNIKSRRILILTAAQYEFEKQRLQQINKKVNDENSYLKDHIKRLQENYHHDINTLQEKLQKLHKVQTENEELRQFKFETEYQRQVFNIDKLNFINLTKNLDKRQREFKYELQKFNKINHQQKLCTKISNPQDFQTATTLTTRYQLNPQHDQTRVLSLIQRYLLGDFQIEEIFDNPSTNQRIEQIKQVIQQLKQHKIANRNPIIRIPSKNKGLNQQQQLDEVLVHRNNDTGMESVFEFFNPKTTSLQLIENDIIDQVKPTETQYNNDFQQFQQEELLNKTTEKNYDQTNHQLKKQIQQEIEYLKQDNLMKQTQIYNLKQKLMSIRKLLLDFFIIFQIPHNLTEDKQQALNLILDFFQYSEEQTQTIYEKKKNGFFASFFQ